MPSMWSNWTHCMILFHRFKQELPPPSQASNQRFRPNSSSNSTFASQISAASPAPPPPTSSFHNSSTYMDVPQSIADLNWYLDTDSNWYQIHCCITAFTSLTTMRFHCHRLSNLLDPTRKYK
ncbi:uncharacterized protein DS421_7g207440 [Arachis hypogaea]|nr:uncharacterized protein DS421_7g207440 [Arachis hypogaea]